MKTNLLPVQPASAFGAPPSGDPGLVNAELRTASRPRYPALKFALLSLLAALCFAAPRAHASGGTVIGWGDNHYGQVNIPADLSGVTNIAAGAFHSLALKSDGTVAGWGHNSYGQVNPEQRRPGDHPRRFERRDEHCRWGLSQPGAEV